MGEEPPSKELKAQWKQQLKMFKQKDILVKIEAVNNCVVDPRFFQEGGAMPLVIGMLLRIKNAEVITAAIGALEALLKLEDVGKDIALLILTEGTKENSAWTAGGLFGKFLAHSDAGIKLSAINSYKMLLERVLELPSSNSTKSNMATDLCETAGPATEFAKLLDHTDNFDIYYPSLVCIEHLLSVERSRAIIMEQLVGENAIVKLAELTKHEKRQVQVTALQIVSIFGTTIYGRSQLATVDILGVLAQILSTCITDVEASASDEGTLGKVCTQLTSAIQTFCRFVCAGDQQEAFPSRTDSCIRILQSLCDLLTKDIVKLRLPLALLTLETIGRLAERSDALRISMCQVGIYRSLFDLVGSDYDAAAPDAVTEKRLRDIVDKVMHICAMLPTGAIDPLLLSAGPEQADGNAEPQEPRTPYLSLEQLNALFKNRDANVQFRAARFAARIVDNPANAIAFGNFIEPGILQLILRIHDQQSNPLTEDEEGPKKLVLESGKLRKLYFYLAKCVKYISAESAHACDEIGAQASIIDILVEWTLDSQHQPSDGPEKVTLSNPRYFKWPWRDAAFERHQKQPTVKMHPPAMAAEALLSSASGYFKWKDSGAKEKTSETPKETKGKGSKKSDPNQATVVGEKACAAVLAQAFRLLCKVKSMLKQPMDVSKRNLMRSILNTVATVCEFPQGRESLLQQAASHKKQHQTKLDDTSCLSLSSWPICADDALKSPHSAILGPILAVLCHPQSTVQDICCAFGVYKTLLVDGNTSISSFDIREAEKFVNVSIALGGLTYLLILADFFARTPQQNQLQEKIDALVKEIAFIVLECISLGSRYYEYTLGQENAMKEEAQATLEEGENLYFLPSNATRIKSQWAKLLETPTNFDRFGLKYYSPLLASLIVHDTNTVSALLEVGVSPNLVDEAGTSALMVAFLMGSEGKSIEALIQAGADIDASTPLNENVLKHCFVSPTTMDLYKSSRSLIDGGITNASSPLAPEVRAQVFEIDNVAGLPKCLDLLLGTGVDVNISDSLGNFPLHWAVSQTHLRSSMASFPVTCRYQSDMYNMDEVLEIVENLITSGANVNACNKAGQTPLHLAILSGHYEIATKLLQHGAEPNIIDVTGALPLHYACMAQCRESPALVQVLLEKGQQCPLRHGTYQDKRRGKSKREKKVLDIEAILSKGLRAVMCPDAVVNERSTYTQLVSLKTNYSKLLPIHFACGAFEPSMPFVGMSEHADRVGINRVEILQMLLHEEHSQDILLRSASTLSCLHYAARSDVNGSNAKLIEMLLTQGLPIDEVHQVASIRPLEKLDSGLSIHYQKNPDGEVIPGYVSSFDEAGLYDILTHDGNHVLKVARQELSIADSKALRGDFAFAPLHYAILQNDDVALQLFRSGAAIAPEGSDVPLLALACFAGRSNEVLKLLMKEQVNVRVNFNGTEGTALHFAVLKDNVEALLFLLQDMEPEIVNTKRSGDGNFPIHVACHLGNPDVISALLEKGATFDLVDNENRSGLHILVGDDNLDALMRVRAYIEANEVLSGADPANFGTSILAAAENRNIELTNNVPQREELIQKNEAIIRLLTDIAQPTNHVHECFSRGQSYFQFKRSTAISSKKSSRSSLSSASLLLDDHASVSDTDLRQPSIS